MDYVRIDTNQGSTEVIFGDPNKYKYNMTNKEKGRIIFINENTIEAVVKELQPLFKKLKEGKNGKE